MSIESSPPDAAGGQSPLRILLYTLITTSNQFSPIRRTFGAYLRNRLVRFAHLASWYLTGRWNAQYWQYEDVQNSNLGDIAVRLGVKKALQAAFVGQAVEFIEVAWGELSSELITNYHDELDLVVIGGGGYLFLDKNGMLPKRFLNDVEALRHAKCPIVATSIGLNQLMLKNDVPARFHPEQREIVRQFVNSLSRFSVRDVTTQRAFSIAAGASPPVIVDPGYLLSENQCAMARRVQGSPIYIGLNLSFHGPFASGLSQQAMTALVQVLKRLSATIPCRFSYFCHADSGRGIVAALRAKGIRLNVFGGSVDGLLDGYRQLDVHIGAMMHSSILAMSCGVPTLALAYDVKSAGFFELFGLGNLIIPLPTLDEETLYLRIVDLVARRREIAAIIASNDRQLRQNSIEFYNEISALTLTSSRSRGKNEQKTQ